MGNIGDCPACTGLARVSPSVVYLLILSPQSTLCLPSSSPSPSPGSSHASRHQTISFTRRYHLPCLWQSHEWNWLVVYTHTHSHTHTHTRHTNTHTHTHTHTHTLISAHALSFSTQCTVVNRYVSSEKTTPWKTRRTQQLDRLVHSYCSTDLHQGHACFIHTFQGQAFFAST